jgi:TIR domain
MSAEKNREPLSSAVSQASIPVGAVFLSYASEDAVAAQRIADALRSAGIDVWFDKSELRGGDAWDRQIRKQIHDCALFIPVISSHSQARLEGYFRREWKLAADRRTTWPRRWLSLCRSSSTTARSDPRALRNGSARCNGRGYPAERHRLRS